MSLDVSLTMDGETVFDANVTHNLGAMAFAAGIYEILWRPEELGLTKAGELVERMAEGLAKLCTDPKMLEHEPANGWGSWETFVPWVTRYLKACRDYPEAIVRADR